MRQFVAVVTLVLVASACSFPETEVISDADPTTTTTEGVAGSNGGGSTATVETSTTVAPEIDLPAGVVEAGAPVPSGTTVRVAGFDTLLDVTLAEVADPATPGPFWDTSPGTRLVGLRVVITNQSEAVWSDSPSNSVSVIGDDDTQHSATFMIIEEGPMFADTTTVPGDVRQGWVVVEVPEGVAVSRVRYTPNSGFADETAEWDLGLDAIPYSDDPAVTIPNADIGDTITLEGFEEIPIGVSVDAIVDPAEADGYFDPEEGNRFVAVQLTLTNTGTLNYNDSVENMPSVITPEGFSYSTTIAGVTAGSGFDGTLLLTPQDTRTGWVIFELPSEQSIAKLTLALDSGFGPEVGEWQLGQA